MSFPTYYTDRGESIFGDDVIFTDIPVDPASLPAPTAQPVAQPVAQSTAHIPTGNGWLDEFSEEEEEEEEEEENETNMDESSADENEPEQATTPVPTSPLLAQTTSAYDPGESSSLIIRTTREEVRFPSTNYRSTSRTARIRTHPPQNTLSFTIASPSVYPSTSPRDDLSSPPTSPQAILETPPTIPVSEDIPPSPPAHTPVPNPNSPIVYLEFTPPTPLKYTPTTSLPAATPPVQEGSITSTLVYLVNVLRERIDDLEGIVGFLPGPARFEYLENGITDLEDRVHITEHRTHQLGDRVLAPGGMGDRFEMLQAQVQALQAEVDYLRARDRYRQQVRRSMSGLQG